MTPLHKAANKGRLEVVKLLVERGADLEAKTKKGKSVLEAASKKARLFLLKLMLDH